MNKSWLATAADGVQTVLGRRKKGPYRELETVLGYRFQNPGLLEAALTHRSYRFENEGIETDNQRLEFLGDAVLGFLMAAFAYEAYAARDEGFMTACRSHTTSGRALAKVAAGIDLGRHLRIGKGEEMSGGRKRPSSLADAMESVIGAAYLDGGVPAARRIFERLFVPLLDGYGDVWVGNPKGRLQEHAQRVWRAAPRYHLKGREGSAHDGVFTAEVELPDGSRIEGRGPNKRKAESAAAHAAVQRLTQQAGGPGGGLPAAGQTP